MELKFRAWDKVNDKMADVYGIDFNNSKATLRYEPFRVEGCIPLDRLVLMQWTGLYDMNGKPIYADDILEGTKQEQTTRKNSQTIVSEVMSSLGGFECFSHSMTEFSWKDDKRIKWLMWYEPVRMVGRDYYWEIVDIKVIGNVYEGLVT